jgi:hypothetical protein
VHVGAVVPEVLRDESRGEMCADHGHVPLTAEWIDTVEGYASHAGRRFV